jgi:hypothetical protein
VTKLCRLALAAQSIESLGLPRVKLGDIIDPDAKLDEMDRHLPLEFVSNFSLPDPDSHDVNFSYAQSPTLDDLVKRRESHATHV